jgi:hypothetical protein
MLGYHFTEAGLHSVFAAVLAPIIGVFMSAFLDWLGHRFKKKNATVREMLHCCVEGLVGGGIEGYFVALIVAGIKVLG